MAGSVSFKNGLEVPFLGDKLITELEGQKIVDAKSAAVIGQNILTGRIEFQGQVGYFPFLGNKVFKQVANRQIKKARAINFLESGLLFGYFTDINHKPILVWGDKLLEELQEETSMVIVLKGKNSDYGVIGVNLKMGKVSII